MALVPLKITWRLASPMVAGPNPLHLDALVAYALVQETLEQLGAGSLDDVGPQTIREIAKQPLPLGREERDGKWVWQASAIRRSEGISSHGMRHWIRKTHLYDHANRIERGQLMGNYKLPLDPFSYTPKLDTQRKAFKQMFKFYPIEVVNEVSAWCIGDPDRLDELLSPDRFVTHLGAKARMGHGKVAGHPTIVKDERALLHWQDRVLPWPHVGGEAMRLATHPPYWAPENLGPAWAKPELFS